MATTKWVLDTSHSEIQFKVRHMMIANVTGKIQQFDANVETEGDDFTTAKIHFTGEVSSITTNNAQRDGHLQGEDFFDAANHPQIKFEATKLEKIDDEHYTMTGKLTMRDTTKEETFKVTFGGMQKDPWGNLRAGFSIEGKVNRKQYGLNWHAVTEAGGIVAGDEIKIQAEVEFIKKTDDLKHAA